MFIGQRNPFRKLLAYTEPPDVELDRFRAWLLCVACGADPITYGLGDTDVPEPYDASDLRELLSDSPR